MFILTQAGWLQNSNDNIYLVQDTELEKQYMGLGYQRYERNYKIKEQHKEYTVICPEFRHDTKNAETIVIIPEFFLPARPYPVYVYLYAIDLYSNAPEKGQRQVAEETRKFFGLTTFAHTTLGRALKAFIQVICDCDTTPDGVSVETTVSEDAKPSGFPTVQATEKLRKQAADFLRGMLSRTELHQVVTTCRRLARKWFIKYGHFLL
jgi:hypothetical protein